MKKLTKKRKRPYDSYTVTTGDIDLNIQHFNKCAGTDGGPITEALDLSDMSKYDISDKDFMTVQSRYTKYHNYNGEIPDSDLICSPEGMALANFAKPVQLIKYWIIARLIHWDELAVALEKQLKKRVKKDELKTILDYYKTPIQQKKLTGYTIAFTTNKPKTEALYKNKKASLKENTSKVSAHGIIKKSRLATKNSSKNTALNEAKRYVRRYYIRPQNIFCSNKTDVIQALIQFEDQDCSVYTLNNLGEEKDVTKLTNKDIIYYYDDGILYDKNHMKVMDYDLAIKHEEERPNIDIDQTSDTKLSKVYQDRLTGWTEVEEAFNLHFDPVNAYGETLCEGKAINGTCCICGEPIEGYGNNPEPVVSAENGERCCDACNLKFVIPARLDQWMENSDNEN